MYGKLYEKLKKWANVIYVFSDISESDFMHYKKNRVYDIQNEDVKKIVLSHCFEFGHIIEFIEDTIKEINSVDDDFNIQETFVDYQESWMNHIDHREQNLIDLKKKCMNMIIDIDKKQQILDTEFSDIYSSYSDYSSSSESEEED